MNIKIYRVYGYFLDNGDSIDGCLITDTHDSLDDIDDVNLSDEDIFYYGMNVPKEMGNGEFKITDWEVFI